MAEQPRYSDQPSSHQRRPQRNGTPRHAAQHSAQRRAPQRDARPPQRQRPQSRSQQAARGQRGAARPQARQPQPSRGNQYARYGAQPPRRKSSMLPAIAGGVIALVLIVAILLIFVFPLRYDVTINGARQTINRGTTITAVIDEGMAAPKPGDLLAVDGSLLESGGGDAFSATINGEVTNDGNRTLEKDAIVEITDGANTTEPYTETEEVVPYGEVEGDTDFSSYWNASLHVYEKGKDGLNRTRTGELSGKTITEEVEPMVNAGYTIRSANVGDDKVVALTFDDGPWPETTAQILDILEENDAKATFFTIGEQISNNPDEVKRAYEMGCEICTHTWDHAAGSGGGVNICNMSSSEQIEEVTKGMAAINDLLGVEVPRILRAPGGNFYGDAVTTLASYLDAEIGWDVDTEDWARPGSNAIYEAIMSVKPGQVVLMHDGGGDRSQTVEAVAQAIPELAQKGYKFITVSELLAYGGSSETEDGETSESATTSETAETSEVSA